MKSKIGPSLEFVPAFSLCIRRSKAQGSHQRGYDGPDAVHEIRIPTFLPDLVQTEMMYG